MVFLYKITSETFNLANAFGDEMCLKQKAPTVCGSIQTPFIFMHLLSASSRGR